MVSVLLNGYFGFDGLLGIPQTRQFTLPDDMQMHDLLNQLETDNAWYQTCRNHMLDLSAGLRDMSNVRRVCWIYGIDAERLSRLQRGDVDGAKTGKWMLFVKRDAVDFCWDKLSHGICSGIFDSFKISVPDAALSQQYDPTELAIMVYTNDYDDRDYVAWVLQYLRQSGVAALNRSPYLFYKTDYMTRQGQYFGGQFRSWLYSSADFEGG